MRKVKSLLFVILAGFIVAYFYMPVVSFGFLGFPVFLLILIGLWITLNSPFNLASLGDQTELQNLKIKKPGKIWLIIIGIILIYMTVVPVVTSWALFRTNDYRDLIGKIDTEANLSNHMLPISIEKIRVVDQSLAQLLGDKVLGSQPALGSQVTLGEFNIQKVNNDLYWVAPLLHSGFFK